MILEKIIISDLEKGALSKMTLLNNLVEKRGTTVQAIYKALRKLRSEGKIVEHKKSLSLSMWYIEKELKRWGRVSSTYKSRLSYGDFIFLEQGKKFVKYFDTYNDLDRYWVTAFLLVERVLPQDIPSYTLIPHDWYIYANIESDVFWTKNHKQKQRLIITNPFDIDKIVATKRRKNGYEVMYGVNPFHQDDRRHYSIVGNWIFEVDFDKRFTEKLMYLIKPLKSIADVDTKTLKNLVEQKGRFKMSVYHNEKKSMDMTRRLIKYFD